MRPDGRRREVEGACVETWPDAELVAHAGVALVGSYDDVDASNAATMPVGRCEIPHTHFDRGRWISKLRADRAKVPGPPLRFVHMHRFDVVAATLAAEPGFRADFLVRTDRPWKQVLDFFAADRSPACGPDGCRFSFAPAGREDRMGGAWLSDWIDKSGGKKRHESVVYYLVRGNHVRRHFWPAAAIADLRNRDYRAWRVELAKRAVELGHYDAIDLNQKFSMYRREHWIDSAAVPDTAKLRARGAETLWTAPPKGYGYPEYVEGWAALSRDLRAAGVPYAVSGLSAWPWIRDRADDPSSPRDEGKMIEEAVRGARLVIVERHARSDPAGLLRWAAELEAAGVQVAWIDTRCGWAKR